MDQKEIIRREYFLNRKSMREIAKELHHGRKTIRKAIYDPGIPVYKRSKSLPPREPSAPLWRLSSSGLQEDKQRPTKQRHTAKRIYERLQDEYGYPGLRPDGEARSEPVKRQDSGEPRASDLSARGWRHLRFRRGLRDAWAAGRPRCTWAVCAWITPAIILSGPAHERQEALFECHLRGFRLSGGVPRADALR